METQRDANPAPGFASHPDHRIDIAPAATRARALLDGTVLADSRSCLLLREGGYPPIHYFPRANVRMDLLTRTDHHTRCPFKGEASYWSAGGEDNIAWSYESPYDETQAIAGYVAFYPDRVTIEAD